MFKIINLNFSFIQMRLLSSGSHANGSKAFNAVVDDGGQVGA